MKAFRKKLMSAVLAAAMLVGLLPTSALAAHTNEGAEYDGLGSAQIYINPAPADDEALTPASELPNYSATLGPVVGDDIYPYTIQIQEGQTAADFYAEARVQMNLSVATTLANNDTLDVVKTRFLIFMAVSENINVDTQTNWLFNSTFLTPDEDVLTSYNVEVRRATYDEYSSSYVSETETAIDMGWVMSGDLNKLIIPNPDQVDAATTTGTFDFGPYFDDENCYVDDGNGTLELGDRVNTAFGPVLGIGSSAYPYSHNMNIYAIPVKMNWEAVRDAIADGSIKSSCQNPTEINENSAAGGSLYTDFTEADFMAPMELTALNTPDKGLKMTVDFTSLKPSYRAENSEELGTRDNWFVGEQYLVDQFIPTTSDKDEYGTDWIHYVDAIPVSGVIGGAVYAYQSADAGESGLILGRYGTDAIDAGTILVQFTKPVTGDIKVEKTIKVQDGVSLTEEQKPALAALGGTELGITVTNANGEEVAEGNTLTLSWDETAQTLTASGKISGLASDSTYDVAVDAESTAALEEAGLYLQGGIEVSGGEDIDLTDYYQLTRNKDGTVNTSGLIDADKIPTVTVTSTYSTTKPVVPTVTLTYEPNGGIGTSVQVDYEPEETATIKSVIEVGFTRTGYTFTGWNTRADGKGTDYAPGSTITLTENTTLYAQWQKDGEEPVETPDTVLSKTLSGNLDENGETDVTLSIPSDGYKQTVDVVLAVDCSNFALLNTGELRTSLATLADKLLQQDIKLNVGVVGFGMDAAVFRNISAVNTDNTMTWASDLVSEISQNVGSFANAPATNIQAGVRRAHELLDNSTSGADSNHQYMVLMTDGAGYWYCDDADIDDDGNTSEGVNKLYRGSFIGALGNADGNNDVGKEDRKTHVGQSGDFAAFMEQYGDDVERSTANSYTADQLENPTADMVGLTYDEVNGNDYFLNMERGTYLAAREIEEVIADGYKVITIGDEYKMINGAATPACLKTISDSFRAWTGSENVGRYYDFDEVENAFNDLSHQITYFVDAGSYVIDEMGSGTDSKWAYDFDFVNDAQYLTLTVGGEALEVTDLGNNSYGFGDSTGSADGTNYPFVLTYSPDENPNDFFRLDINVPVLASEPVQLTYRVKQVNEEDGNVHGQYDPDGSQNSTGLFTNDSAVLYPKDGPKMEFPKPTVSCGNITITPADITIYTGGDGYDSVITGSGDSEVGTASNGLPTPGFYITLPEEVNAELIKSAKPEDVYTVDITDEEGNVTKQKVVDLSDYLSFTYDDGQGNERLWELERYDQNENDNDSMAYSKFIYRIKPAEIKDDAGNVIKTIPIRLQFIDEDGSYTNSDDFTVSLDQLYQDYDMTIYAGDLNQGLVKAVLTVGDESTEYSSEVGTGLLKIRGVNEEDPINDVNNGAPSSEVNEITAYVPEDANFYINSSKLEVENPEDVALLVDSIVPDQNNTLYNSAVNEFDQITSSHKYQLQYMDLVDTSNGNAYVTTDKPVDIYWPYPEGTDQNTEFHVVHYEGLDREDEDALEDETYKEKMVLYSEDNDSLETTDHGIKFTVNSFSPFALFWEDDNGGSSGGGGGNKPDDLNTEDHFAYIIGYPKDYQTGEPTDDESLWPVEPQGNITRAEVATIFFRMLTDEARDENWSQTNSYTDVASTDWYNNAISTLSNMGIISGDPSGAFRPDDSITRAEFTKIAVGFFDKAGDYVDGTYDDVSSSDWYADFIDAAVDLGLIEGYPDGTIRPEATITRAEACTIVNRTLGRVPDKDHLLPADEMRVWPDNSDTNEWYYAQIQEATNSHDYEWIGEENDQIENWTEKLEDRDWAQLEREWSDANSAPGGEVVD